MISTLVFISLFELFTNAPFLTFAGGALTTLGAFGAKYLLFKGKKVSAESEYRAKEWENLRELREAMDKRFADLDSENTKLRSRIQELEAKVEGLQSELVDWQARAIELEREKVLLTSLIPDHCLDCPLARLSKKP